MLQKAIKSAWKKLFYTSHFFYFHRRGKVHSSNYSFIALKSDWSFNTDFTDYIISLTGTLASGDYF